MHPRYAAIFGIENLELNQHFRPKNTHSTLATATHTQAVPLTVSSQLLNDIKLSAKPIVINNVLHGEQMHIDDDKLTLPTSQLSANDKRALWALMSTHLDKL
ncbi:hypothetical protein PESP_a3052 [Pseudoalteromonas espejiana DSM 9414]|uniref:Uncharacterized protein n=1 Tax=Pseudoalteromonas espejiana TaxID=28107 RepID=A0A510XSQ2_9GAMM|nr:hypothetical protein [Pseudoalteromonas espejiana]ASM50923.1 hypothetical protein PESP_a3052 [Pseudoalteromonas espejiana DSM 9414]GEK54058.1 hypothetical protein PES01_09030 [Pseudoalteromonas espejiana]